MVYLPVEVLFLEFDDEEAHRTFFDAHSTGIGGL